MMNWPSQPGSQAAGCGQAVFRQNLGTFRVLQALVDERHQSVSTATKLSKNITGEIKNSKKDKL